MSFIEIYETKKIITATYEEFMFLKIKLQIINKRFENFGLDHSLESRIKAIDNLSQTYNITQSEAKLIIFETIIEHYDILQKIIELKIAIVPVLEQLKQISIEDYHLMYELVEPYIK